MLDSMDITPENMFAMAADASNQHDPDKALAILIWDEKEYGVSTMVSGMSRPEILAALETAKHIVLRQMLPSL